MDLEAERQLIEQAKTNPEAFGLLYDEYYGKILGYAICRVTDIAAAQDITSEVFFKALKNLKGYKWRGISFSSWLYRIAGNEIANHYSRNGHSRLLTDELKHSFNLTSSLLEEEALRAEAEQDKRTEFTALRQAFLKLSVKYQEVIALRFFEEKQLSEIAQILGKREGTVKSLLHRGLEKLRAEMQS
jgi:RNA polymerase sigma-70 factor (ECF subfamily)